MSLDKKSGNKAFDTLAEIAGKHGICQNFLGGSERLMFVKDLYRRELLSLGIELTPLTPQLRVLYRKDPRYDIKQYTTSFTFENLAIVIEKNDPHNPDNLGLAVTIFNAAGSPPLQESTAQELKQAMQFHTK